MFPTPPSWIQVLSKPDASLALAQDTGTFPLTCLVSHSGTEEAIQKDMSPWLARVALWIQAETSNSCIELDVEVHIVEAEVSDTEWN